MLVFANMIIGLLFFMQHIGFKTFCEIPLGFNRISHP